MNGRRVIRNGWRILIVFNAGSEMYGMERAVIETFDLLRPEVEPHFLMSYTTKRLDRPILKEIQQRGLNYSFFSDKTDWPRIGWPQSLKHLFGMIKAMIKGNLDILRECSNQDIIYVPGVQYFYFVILASIVHRMQGKRILYHFHDLITRPSLKLRLASVPITDFVHNTKLGYQSVVAASPYLSKKRNFVIPCAIRKPVSHPIHDSPTSYPNEKRNILFVGQVSKPKGVDILLDAFETLIKSYQNLVLNIVGGCDDRVLRQRLENGVAGNGCEVKWWGYRDDVGHFLGGAYLYVHPSPPSRVNESFGIGLVEAMSVGLPAVCFQSGALQEIVINEQTGLVCEQESAECLARNIERMLNDNELRERCGMSSRKRYEECFRPGRVKELWSHLIGF